MKKLFLAVLAILLANCASTAPVTQPQTQTAQVQAPCPTASAVPVAPTVVSKPVVRFATYKVTVDGSKPLADMVAEGRYDEVSPEVTQQNFPFDYMGKGPVDVILVEIPGEATYNKIFAEFDGQGLRPATIHELLALGAAYPELQRQFSIVAYGSTWASPRGYNLVPVLIGASEIRDLVLRWGNPDGKWPTGYRFLAVRK